MKDKFLREILTELLVKKDGYVIDTGSYLNVNEVIINGLLKKIERHPLIWKMFFMVVPGHIDKDHINYLLNRSRNESGLNNSFDNTVHVEGTYNSIYNMSPHVEGYSNKTYGDTEGSEEE